jgi:hypothetical protein
MKRLPVTSSDLLNVGYEEETKTLEIEFKKGGLYQYKGVPINIFKSLITASSKGKFFHVFIEKNFVCIKLR